MFFNHILQRGQEAFSYTGSNYYCGCITGETSPRIVKSTEACPKETMNTYLTCFFTSATKVRVMHLVQPVDLHSALRTAPQSQLNSHRGQHQNLAERVACLRSALSSETADNNEPT